MVCREVGAQLLAPDAVASPGLAAHLDACPSCAGTAAALAILDARVRSAAVVAPPAALQERLAALSIAAVVLAPEALAPEAACDAAANRVDHALRTALVAEPPAELQTRLAAVVPAASKALSPRESAPAIGVIVAGGRIESALRSSLVVAPPAGLRARLADVLSEAAAARVQRAVCSSLVVEPPAELRARLAALAPRRTDAASETEGWLAGIWRNLQARPGVLAGQLAALAVLAYAVTQLLAWVGSFPIVWGDVPYALELLALSPAVDYLSQVEAVIQQFGLWLVVAAAGWILAQGAPWQRQPKP
jgi:hypothetical protein